MRMWYSNWEAYACELAFKLLSSICDHWNQELSPDKVTNSLDINCEIQNTSTYGHDAFLGK